MIKTDLEPFCAESIDDLAEQIAPAWSVRDFVIRVFRVPHAEPFMVFRRNDEIFHSCLARGFRPFLRIEKIGVELFKIFFVVLVRNFFIIADPFMSSRHGIEPPVNEHSEPVVREPACVAFSEISHFPFPFFVF